MIRHGELISTPGTSDKVPALDFHWYKYDGTPVDNLDQSRIGGMLSFDDYSVSYNHVCASACHAIHIPGGGETTYTRNPGDVLIIKVWAEDEGGNEATVFSPGEEVHYHVQFKVFGADSSFLKTFLSSAYNTSGTSWETPLARNATYYAGLQEWKWAEHIPISATPDSSAQIRIKIKNFEYQGGPLIGSHTAFKNFEIVP
ncbi:MAG: hypothetical protein JRI47_03925 [Deltaproteobacteria bacterium]|nr:hypothetical protein [Deltaproteobacteria bacterium]